MSELKNRDVKSLLDELTASLDTRLLPWSRGTAAPLVWGVPPLRDYSQVHVRKIRKTLLPSASRLKAGMLTEWTKEKMVAGAYPMICCVLEGELERVIGITTRMASENPSLDPAIGRYAVRLPASAFLIAPGGTPFDDGREPHWADPKQRVPDSGLFWVNPQPSGVILHICRTRQGEHRNFGGLFVPDSHVLTLCELMMDDLRSKEPQDSMARGYLSLILLRISQALHRRQVFAADSPQLPLDNSSDTRGNSDSALAQSARRYITAHFNHSLSARQIAAHCYVSASHLNRVFRREFGLTPVAYMERCRVETARSLLTDTKMSVYDLSNYLGYKHPDVFRRAFQRHQKCSPVSYRRAHRTRPS